MVFIERFQTNCAPEHTLIQMETSASHIVAQAIKHADEGDENAFLMQRKCGNCLCISCGLTEILTFTHK